MRLKYDSDRVVLLVILLYLQAQNIGLCTPDESGIAEPHFKTNCTSFSLILSRCVLAQRRPRPHFYICKRLRTHCCFQHGHLTNTHARLPIRPAVQTNIAEASSTKV